MTTTCPSCGKALKVKDEYAGKRLKCPGCGEAFQASATSSAAPRAAQPNAKTSPRAAGSTVPQRTRPADKTAAPTVAISSNVVLGAAAALLVAFVVLFVIFGPAAAQRFRSAHEQQAENDVRDVVELAMKSYASHAGIWNPRKASGPSVGDVSMIADYTAIRTPRTTKVDGYGTSGQFAGTYHFDTGEVDVNLELGGMMLPGGGAFVGPNGVSVAAGERNQTSPLAGKSIASGKTAGGTLHVTGRLVNGNPQVEIDGRPADVYYPPQLDEDGNVIAPATRSAT